MKDNPNDSVADVRTRGIVRDALDGTDEVEDVELLDESRTDEQSASPVSTGETLLSDVADVADTVRCLERYVDTFALGRRGDRGSGNNGIDVALSRSGISAVGDLAGFRCGIGGVCIGLARVSSRTKRETSSSWSSRLPGKSYMDSKRSAMGATTLSSRANDPL